HSANLTFDNTNTLYFNGDTSRLMRSTKTVETITWNLSGLNQFKAITYHWPFEGLSHFTFYTSPDNVTYTAITPSLSNFGGEWVRVDYTFNPPPGTNYVKVEFPNTAANNWNPQISQVTVGGSGGPTATPGPTDTPAPPTATFTPSPTPTYTNTPVPPTNTNTATAVPTTATPTNTSVPPTSTPTNTAVPPTATPTLSVSNTGWISPGAHAAQTGGDGNGFQTSAAEALSDNAVFASDVNSGNTTSTNCADAGKDKHAFYTYALSIPGGATITGLEVR